jgi:hypothetical protein
MSHTRLRWSILTATVALIIALAGTSLPALIAAPDPTPTAYPLPATTAVLSDEPPAIVLTAVPSSDQSERPTQTLIAETAHYRFLVESGDFTADTIPNLAERAETVYTDVVARFSGFADVGLAKPLSEEPLTVIIARPTAPVDAGCTVRGIALYGDPPQIKVFADSTVSEAYFWGVLSHETAHMIHAEGLAGFSRHQPLTEGLATWNSASYWAAWMGADSLDDLVRGYLASGEYLPLYENYDLALAYNGPDCLHYRDILYSEWASFTGYLIDEYGFGRYGALMDSAPPEPRRDDDLGRVTVMRPADFEGIYGLALNQLEARWLARLRAGDDTAVS